MTAGDTAITSSTRSNRDKPFDQFVVEQLAGDELAPGDPECPTASIFTASARSVATPAIPAGDRPGRNEVLTERTDILGTTFWPGRSAVPGATITSWSRSLRSDYYRFQAFLAATEEHDISLGDASPAHSVGGGSQADSGRDQEAPGEVARRAAARRHALALEIEAMEDSIPPPPATIPAIWNDSKQRTPIHVLNFSRCLGEQGGTGRSTAAERARCRRPAPQSVPRPARSSRQSAGSLACVARTSADGPGDCQPDVAASFRDGAGQVGQRLRQRAIGPATRNCPTGWPRRSLRMAAASADPPPDPLEWHLSAGRTRCRGTRPRLDEAVRDDPEDRLLWQFNRRRLEAEEIRDAMLAVSGRLNARAGGPSVMVPVAPGIVRLLLKPSQWQVVRDQAEYDRRSIYLIAKRNCVSRSWRRSMPPLLTSCSRRESSTHAPAPELAQRPPVQRALPKPRRPPPERGGRRAAFCRRPRLSAGPGTSPDSARGIPRPGIPPGPAAHRIRAGPVQSQWVPLCTLNPARMPGPLAPAVNSSATGSAASAALRWRRCSTRSRPAPGSPIRWPPSRRIISPRRDP